MNTVTVKYVGPGSDTDKREMKVSEAEAISLCERGLWKTIKPRSTRKKETSNG